MPRDGHSETSLLEEGERKLSSTLIRLALRLKLSPVQILFAFSIIVGLVSGFGAYIFKQLIVIVDDICFLNTEEIPALGRFIILVPALGGAVVGPLIYFFAKEVKGGGVPETMKLSKLAPKIGKELHTSLPVVDEGGELVGIVTYKQLHPAMASDTPNEEITVKDFMDPDPVVAYPGETAADVFQRMTEAYAGIAPVVKRYGLRKVIGIVTYRHVFAAYQKALKE